MTETQQQTQSTDEQQRPSAFDYARRHPALTAIGAAAVGLLGGVEVAAGVLIGAGVMALTRARDGRQIQDEAKEMKERGRQVMSRMPDVKERARAVMQAARGRLHSDGQSSS
ncbi:MAG: hypothetical protein HOV81_29165 [Kofleriaceae bacterium]|nr:hypothetical protein [Kofleriaceae bacterium]